MKDFKSWNKYDIETFDLIPVSAKIDNSLRKKKHAVWILNRYVPLYNAGSEHMAHVINKFLVQKGWDVTVLAPEITGTRFEGVHTIQFDDTKRVVKALAEASVVLAQHTYEPIAERVAKNLQLPIVYVIHENTRIPHLHKRIHYYDPKKIHLIYNSTWLDRFYKSRGFNLDSTVLFPPVIPKDYAFKREPKYVGLINCNGNKGGDLLIELAKKMPDIEFMGVLGAYGKQRMEKDIPNLHYMKNTADKKAMYKNMDIILMPSKRESWGRVAVESMSLGIPVIAHPTQGLKESLGDAGLFASRYKPEEWVTLIRKLKSDPWFYSRKSMEGQVRAQEVYRPDQLDNLEVWLSKL